MLKNCLFSQLRVTEIVKWYRNLQTHTRSLQCTIPYYHIRAIFHVRICVDDNVTKTVTSCHINAHLDSCSSLLY